MSARTVVHVVEGLGIGGIERVVEALVRHADRARVRPRVLCAARGGPLAGAIEASGAKVSILGVAGYYPRDVVRAARALRAAGADLVHSHGHFAGVLARAAAWCAGIPAAVHHLHTIDTTLRPRHRRLERWLGRRTARVICCSEAVAEHARRDLGLRPALLRRVANGIDPPPAVGRDEARRLLGDPPAPVVACLGGLAPHKGQAVLLEAFATLARAGAAATLVLIGDGPERGALEARARAAGMEGRVRFLGERPDARRLLPGCDLVAVPSLDREGFSLAAVEAMDAGVPVVASRVGGLPEVLDEGRAGTLVPAGDAPALAAAIGAALRDPGPPLARAAAARRRVETEYRAPAMARVVESVYEEVPDVRRAAA